MTEPTIEELQSQIADLVKKQELSITEIKALKEQAEKDKTALEQSREITSKLILNSTIPETKADGPIEETFEDIIQETIDTIEKQRKVKNGN